MPKREETTIISPHLQRGTLLSKLEVLNIGSHVNNELVDYKTKLM